MAEINLLKSEGSLDRHGKDSCDDEMFDYPDWVVKSVFPVSRNKRENLSGHQSWKDRSVGHISESGATSGNSCPLILVAGCTATLMVKRSLRLIYTLSRGIGDKWVVPVPADNVNMSDLWATKTLCFCNITEPPQIERGLFSMISEQDLLNNYLLY